MRQWIRSHLTYANVISTVCLFLLLGGGTAVALNGANTVQSDDLGPSAQVKAPDVAANAVNGANIVNNSVTGGDVNESTLRWACAWADAGLQPGRDWPGCSPQADRDGRPLQAQRYLRQQPGFLGLGVYVTGPAGFAETEFSQVDNDTTDAGDHSQSSVPPANVETKVIKLNADSGFGRDGGTLVIRSNTGRMVQVLFSATLDQNAAAMGACHVLGTATTG